MSSSSEFETCMNTIFDSTLSKNSDYDNTARLENGEYCAIEIFTTTGSGTTILDGESNHFMINNNKLFSQKMPNFNLPETKKFVSLIRNNFYTLPFCQRYVDKTMNNNNIFSYKESINELHNKGFLNIYPPLIDPKENAIVAQFEETIFVGSNKTINLSNEYI